MMKRYADTALVHLMTNDTFNIINKKTGEKMRIRYGDRELRSIRFLGAGAHLLIRFFIDKHPEIFTKTKRKEGRKTN